MLLLIGTHTRRGAAGVIHRAAACSETGTQAVVALRGVLPSGARGSLKLCQLLTWGKMGMVKSFGAAQTAWKVQQLHVCVCMSANTGGCICVVYNLRSVAPV